MLRSRAQYDFAARHARDSRLYNPLVRPRTRSVSPERYEHAWTAEVVGPEPEYGGEEFHWSEIKNQISA